MNVIGFLFRDEILVKKERRREKEMVEDSLKKYVREMITTEKGKNIENHFFPCQTNRSSGGSGMFGV